MADRTTDNEEAKKRKEKRAEAKRKRKRRELLIRALVLLFLMVILATVIIIVKMTQSPRIDADDSVVSSVSESSALESIAAPADHAAESGLSESVSESTGGIVQESIPAYEGETPSTVEEALALASHMASMYDYDGAIAMLEGYPDYANEPALAEKISALSAEKTGLVQVDVSTTAHVFFHSLINDSRGLIASATCTEERVEKNNKAMTTVGEFNAMIQKMYEAGYVLISLDDLIVRTTAEDGSEVFSKNRNLYLPAGKKPLIMSEDDLSYYHSYGENGAQGYADRLVVDENGEVKCQFTTPEGERVIGDYDMVPILETFLKEHPDFCYKGARPTIALTGYNGVFGYRTNDYYKEGPDGEDLNAAQKKFLRDHPEYDYDTDVAEATKVAEALKKAGWTFASHTYGHVNATDASLEKLKRDHERWKIAVEKVIGKTNKIIFAFGADIGPVGGYTENNEKFMYYKEQGFDIFCNVDGNIGWTEFGSNYVRTGRVALDGVSMYNAMDENTVSHKTYSHDFEVLGITDIASFFDPNRNPAYCLSES
ncbi:MAG: hypothetical protein K6E30_01135 [Lachnospiraceae bacterium]|nr:hypothetical protein [Lachnospiraceae bacterium]